MTTKLYKAAAVGFIMISASSAATAAEIKVVASVGIQAALEELVPQFERASEHKLKVTFGAASELKQQIDGGETFDVAVLTPAIIDDLIKQGKVDAHSNVARTWIGIEVRAGAPKPDIGTVDALKRTLLGAKSIVYTTTGLGALPIAHVIEQLGIAEQLKSKTVVVSQRPTALAVADGRAELGFALVSEILTVAGVELVAPVPSELKSYVAFTAGVSAKAKDPAAARRLLDFLTSPATAPVLKAKGMEPLTQ